MAVMHPDLIPLVAKYAESEKAFWCANEELNRSSAVFMRSDSGSMKYYAISAEHERRFREWSDALHAMERGAHVLQLRALDLSGISEGHPLRFNLRGVAT